MVLKTKQKKKKQRGNNVNNDHDGDDDDDNDDFDDYDDNFERIVAALNQIGFLFYVRDNHNKTVVLCRASGGVRINLSHL